MRSPAIRAVAAALAVSLWMLLLFSGLVLGGAVHLLLAAALALFPWRSAGAAPGERATPEEDP